jgi:hypothetical protein
VILIPKRTEDHKQAQRSKRMYPGPIWRRETGEGGLAHCVPGEVDIRDE